ncbi:hypothetical protein BHM03_00059129 [Ensete ventricosum]|nr:hypothetical protein BHM03_00059129 [Ensete ventricosum]
MAVVSVETTVASSIPLFGYRLHWIGCLKESFLSDLEENLSLGRVERGVREPQDGVDPTWLDLCALEQLKGVRGLEESKVAAQRWDAKAPLDLDRVRLAPSVKLAYGPMLDGASADQHSLCPMFGLSELSGGSPRSLQATMLGVTSWDGVAVIVDR